MWQTDSGPSIQLTSGPSYQIERNPEENKFSKKAQSNWHFYIQNDNAEYRMTDFTDLAAQKIQGWNWIIQALFKDFMQFSRLRPNSSTFQDKG